MSLPLVSRDSCGMFLRWQPPVSRDPGDMVFRPQQSLVSWFWRDSVQFTPCTISWLPRGDEQLNAPFCKIKPPSNSLACLAGWTLGLTFFYVSHLYHLRLQTPPSSPLGGGGGHHKPLTSVIWPTQRLFMRQLAACPGILHFQAIKPIQAHIIKCHGAYFIILYL